MCVCEEGVRVRGRIVESSPWQGQSPAAREILSSFHSLPTHHTSYV